VAQANLPVDFNRNYGAVTQGTLSGSIPTVSVADATFGGWYSNLIRLPPSLDTRQPLYLTLTVSPIRVNPIDGQFVVFQTRYTVISSLLATFSVQFNQTWAVPNGFVNNSIAHVLLDNGTGVTIPKNSLPQQPWLAVRVARLGSDAADTFTSSLHLCLGMSLAYTSRYPWLINTPPF